MPGGLTWWELPTPHCVLFVSVQTGDLTPDGTVVVVKYMWLGTVNILEDRRKMN